jgi:hypothetical protein
MTRRHYAHLLDSVVAAELQANLPTFKARRSARIPCDSELNGIGMSYFLSNSLSQD